MEILVVGLNHKTAPVEVREKLSFLPQRLPEAMQRLKACRGIREGLILSTCNRTEVYTVAGDADEGVAEVILFLSRHHQVDPGVFTDHLYFYQGMEAVRHLFRVACGLDSMVLGETQILGQVKEAYLAAKGNGVTGKVCHNLFEQALNVGKRAHTETAISQNAVSVSYAAVELARKVFRSLEGRKVLLIGAGKMSELTARHLQSCGIKEVIVANRTLQAAEELAARFHGKAVELKEVQRWLEAVDLVISSTGAPHLIVRRDTMVQVMRARRGRPLFLIDIAVPRDIDPGAGELDGVFLYDIDDLEQVVEANLRERRREAWKVERIIEEEVARFAHWWNTQEVVPIIRSLREKMEGIRRREVERALAKLPHLNERERNIIEGMTSLIVNKILNDPTVKIKEYANGANREVYLATLRDLFNLQIPEETESFGAADRR